MDIMFLTDARVKQRVASACYIKLAAIYSITHHRGVNVMKQLKKRKIFVLPKTLTKLLHQYLTHTTNLALVARVYAFLMRISPL